MTICKHTQGSEWNECLRACVSVHVQHQDALPCDANVGNGSHGATAAATATNILPRPCSLATLRARVSVSELVKIVFVYS